MDSAGSTQTAKRAPGRPSGSQKGTSAAAGGVLPAQAPTEPRRPRSSPAPSATSEVALTVAPSVDLSHTASTSSSSMHSGSAFISSVSDPSDALCDPTLDRRTVNKLFQAIKAKVLYDDAPAELKLLCDKDRLRWKLWLDTLNVDEHLAIRADSSLLLIIPVEERHRIICCAALEVYMGRISRDGRHTGTVDSVAVRALLAQSFYCSRGILGNLTEADVGYEIRAGTAKSSLTVILAAINETAPAGVIPLPASWMRCRATPLSGLPDIIREFRTARRGETSSPHSRNGAENLCKTAIVPAAAVSSILQALTAPPPPPPPESADSRSKSNERAIGFEIAAVSSSSSIRAGPAGDGCVVVAYQCVRHAAGCPFSVVVEVPSAIGAEHATLSLSCWHCTDCCEKPCWRGLIFSLPPSVDAAARTAASAGADNSSVMTAAVEELELWEGPHDEGITDFLITGRLLRPQQAPRGRYGSHTRAGAGPDACGSGQVVPACICSRQDGIGSSVDVLWVQCASGSDCVTAFCGWFHGKCLNMSPVQVQRLSDEWRCTGCTQGLPAATFLVPQSPAGASSDSTRATNVPYKLLLARAGLSPQPAAEIDSTGGIAKAPSISSHSSHIWSALGDVASASASARSPLSVYPQTKPIVLSQGATGRQYAAQMSAALKEHEKVASGEARVDSVHEARARAVHAELLASPSCASILLASGRTVADEELLAFLPVSRLAALSNVPCGSELDTNWCDAMHSLMATAAPLVEAKGTCIGVVVMTCYTFNADLRNSLLNVARGDFSWPTCMKNDSDAKALLPWPLINLALRMSKNISTSAASAVADLPASEAVSGGTFSLYTITGYDGPHALSAANLDGSARGNPLIPPFWRRVQCSLVSASNSSICVSRRVLAYVPPGSGADSSPSRWSRAEDLALVIRARTCCVAELRPSLSSALPQGSELEFLAGTAAASEHFPDSTPETNPIASSCLAAALSVANILNIPLPQSPFSRKDTYDFVFASPPVYISIYGEASSADAPVALVDSGIVGSEMRDASQILGNSAPLASASSEPSFADKLDEPRVVDTQWLLRSCMNLPQLLELLRLVSSAGTTMASLTAMAGTLLRYSDGRRAFTSEDGKKAVDYARIGFRGGRLVDQNLVAVITGQMQSAGWVKHDIVFDIHGYVTHLEALIVSDLGKAMLQYTPKLNWCMVFDGTFGTNAHGVDYTPILFIHPETLHVVVVGQFLRLTHTLSDDAVEGEKTRAVAKCLMWFHEMTGCVPTMMMVDKCPAQLAAHVLHKRALLTAWVGHGKDAAKLAPLTDAAESSVLPLPPAAEEENVGSVALSMAVASGIEQSLPACAATVSEYIPTIYRSSNSSGAPTFVGGSSSSSEGAASGVLHRVATSAESSDYAVSKIVDGVSKGLPANFEDTVEGDLLALTNTSDVSARRLLIDKISVSALIATGLSTEDIAALRGCMWFLSPHLQRRIALGRPIAFIMARSAHEGADTNDDSLRMPSSTSAQLRTLQAALAAEGNDLCVTEEAIIAAEHKLIHSGGGCRAVVARRIRIGERRASLRLLECAVALSHVCGSPSASVVHILGANDDSVTLQTSGTFLPVALKAAVRTDKYDVAAFAHLSHPRSGSELILCARLFFSFTQSLAVAEAGLDRCLEQIAIKKSAAAAIARAHTECTQYGPMLTAAWDVNVLTAVFCGRINDAEKFASSAQASAERRVSELKLSRTLRAGPGTSSAVDTSPVMVHHLGSSLADVAAALRSVHDNSCTTQQLSAAVAYREIRTNAKALVGFCSNDLPQPSAVALEAASAIFHEEFVMCHPGLVVGVAYGLHRDILTAVAALDTLDRSMCTIRPATLEGVFADIASWSDLVADNGSALRVFFDKVVCTYIRLCFFHAKKAIREHTQKNSTIPRSLYLAIYDSQIEPDINAIFSAAPSDIDGKWADFQLRWARFPLLVAYMDKNWMHPDWRQLWTCAGRYSISHFLVETSNSAELFFNVLKNRLLDGKAPADIITVIKLISGLPDDPDSIRKSYEARTMRSISAVTSLSCYALRPKRRRVDDRMRKIAAIIATPNSVRPINTEYGLFFVANSATRQILSAGETVQLSDLNAHSVSLLHSACSCKNPDRFCKHLLLCRREFLAANPRPCRTWNDAESFHLVPSEGYVSEDCRMPTFSVMFERLGISAATREAMAATPASVRSAVQSAVAAASSVVTGAIDSLSRSLGSMEIAAEAAKQLPDGATSKRISDIYGCITPMHALLNASRMADDAATAVSGAGIVGSREHARLHAARSSAEVLATSARYRHLRASAPDSAHVSAAPTGSTVTFSNVIQPRLLLPRKRAAAEMTESQTEGDELHRKRRSSNHIGYGASSSAAGAMPTVESASLGYSDRAEDVLAAANTRTQKAQDLADRRSQQLEAMNSRLSRMSAKLDRQAETIASQADTLEENLALMNAPTVARVIVKEIAAASAAEEPCPACGNPIGRQTVWCKAADYRIVCSYDTSLCIRCVKQPKKKPRGVADDSGGLCKNCRYHLDGDDSS